MGERYVEGEIVLSGEARSGTIGDLDLSPGAMYQVSVFAFSYDITTDAPLVGPFNVSEDHMFAQPELAEEEVGQPDVYEFNDRVAWFEELTSNDMVLTGAWWALADWCTSTGTAEKGRCYDLAAEYLLDSFAIDVRTVTAEDWAGQGAVGAVIDDGYMITRRYLANGPEALDPSGRWEDRPPLDWRCDPDCTSAAN